MAQQQHHLRETPTGKKNPPVYLEGAGMLIGESVYSRDGERIGEIEEIMINMNNATINFAIMSFGGFMRLGKRHFAVSWPLLEHDIMKTRFTIGLTQDAINNHVNWQADDWLETSNKNWIREIHSSYGTEPYLTGM